ncbi:unnamed protein product, partial [Fusarium langsethiae]
MAPTAAAANAALALLPPLPNIVGPKLEAFTDDIESHHYTLLEYLGSGVHSAVMRVQINNNIFVVKFFKSYWLDKPAFDMYPLDEDYLMDPTPAKLNAAGNNPQPQAVMDAFGTVQSHLSIPTTQPASRGTGQRICNSHDDLTQPVYAIVKDWVQDHRNADGSPMSNQVKARQIKHIPKMLCNLHQLHKCGIVIRDLKEQQYYEGQIADFSHAWTVPHLLAPGNDVRPAWAWKSMAAWDLHCLVMSYRMYNRVV